VDIETLFQQNVDEALVREANQRPAKTVPTGEYRIQGQPFELEPDTREWSRNKGRIYGRVQAAVYDKTGATKLATVFFDVTPQATKFTTKAGKERLDTPSAIWLQASKAFNLVNNRDIKDAIGQYPLMGYIREQFKTLAGEYITPKTEAERAELIEKGATPYNDVLNVRAVEA
jgi:hypothetical protein